MGFGSTAKKVQKLADTAEKLYSKLNDLREQVAEMRETLDSTSERVERLERENAHQRALLEALAEEQGIDVDGIEADPVESDDETAAEA
ncbi:DUF5798 family protein [Halorussus gelatinilyticus]|uniref:DUF5798 family protein n=1 Tax=Halorussus gelatinilyticus TaxID=2937524 RepID=A0A8U0IEY8_9EURY|nr:DUF5798 family protein [Halorussus gelatinilyticus]UPV99245.1 DUF5798 family protein [Halorussus gelatinilyticus]